MEGCISEQAALEAVVCAIERQIETLEQDLTNMQNALFLEPRVAAKPEAVPVEDRRQQVLEVRLKAIGSTLEVLTDVTSGMLSVLRNQLGSLKLVV